MLQQLNKIQTQNFAKFSTIQHGSGYNQNLYIQELGGNVAIAKVNSLLTSKMFERGILLKSKFYIYQEEQTSYNIYNFECFNGIIWNNRNYKLRPWEQQVEQVANKYFGWDLQAIGSLSEFIQNKCEFLIVFSSKLSKS